MRSLKSILNTCLIVQRVDLPGVDDPSQVKALIKKATVRVPLGSRLAVVLGIPFGLGVLLAIMEILVTPKYFPRPVQGVVVGFTGALLMQHWWKRNIWKALPDVLRAEGRCINCGYQLTDGARHQCPECGKAQRA